MREPLTLAAAGNAVRAVQITDTHISHDPAHRFEGMDTAASLDRVLEAVAALAPAPDCILLTGDLVDEPAAAAYGRLRPRLEQTGLPVYCLPGNHDDPGMLRAALDRDPVVVPGVVDAGRWRLVLLDDFLPGSHGGRLAAPELDRLEAALEAAGRRHVLVCLHHQPVPVECPWMDAMALENPDALFRILDRFTPVRGIIWGHVHQEFDADRRGVRLLASPSTCVQFMPRTEVFTVDPRPPGFRELLLQADGAIDTVVHRVAG